MNGSGPGWTAIGGQVHRVIAYIEIWGFVIAYVGMAIVTQRIAHDKGRRAETWLFYGLLVPGVSLIHALRLSRRPGRAKRIQIPRLLKGRPGDR
jgi:hypothetical protein